MLEFRSQSSHVDVTAIFAIGGGDDSISFTVEGDGDTSPYVHEAVEGAVHGLLSNPVLLLEVLEYYPDSYNAIWNHVVAMLELEDIRTHLMR